MSRKQKLKQLNSVLKNNEDAPAQGTPEWLERRSQSVGGSDMEIFMTDIPGSKPYKSIRSFVEEKLGFTSFRGNKYTRWGNLCEELTRLLCEHIFHTSVHETGALPGSFPNHHYSPDGLGVVDKIYLKSYVPRDLYKTLPDSCFVLFEFKNPYTRIPDGSIPTGYMIQVQTGLNDIKHADIGIFADMTVRYCSLDDLDWSNRYNKTEFPKDSFKDNPMCIGFIGVAKPNNDDASETYDEDIVDFSNMKFTSNIQFKDEEEFIDFGSASNSDFEIMSLGLNSGNLIPYYTQPIPGKFKFYTNLLEFEQFCKDNGYEPVGLLPYKIFQCPIVHLKKDTNFIKEHHKTLIADTINFIKEHINLPKEDQIKALDNKYPKYQKRDVELLKYITGIE